LSAEREPITAFRAESLVRGSGAKLPKTECFFAFGIDNPTKSPNCLKIFFARQENFVSRLGVDPSSLFRSANVILVCSQQSVRRSKVSMQVLRSADRRRHTAHQIFLHLCHVQVLFFESVALITSF